MKNAFLEVLWNLLRQFRNLVLVLLTGYLGFLFGIVVISILIKSVPEEIVFMGVMPLSGGLILVFFKDLVEFLRKVVTFIKDLSTDHLAEIARDSFVIALGFSLSLYVPSKKDDDVKASPILINFSSSGERAENAKEFLFFSNFAISNDQDGDVPIVRFMVSFEEQSDYLEPVEDEFIKRLISNLKTCSQHGGKKLEIQLRGFASSSEFSNTSQDQSDKRNLMLANDRAITVQTAIERYLQGNDQVSVQLHKWENFNEMVFQRNFCDRYDPGSVYSKEMAHLTRRVEINIISAAQCEHADPLQLNQNKMKE